MNIISRLNRLTKRFTAVLSPFRKLSDTCAGVGKLCLESITLPTDFGSLSIGQIGVNKESSHSTSVSLKSQINFKLDFCQKSEIAKSDELLATSFLEIPKPIQAALVSTDNLTDAEPNLQPKTLQKRLDSKKTGYTPTTGASLSTYLAANHSTSKLHHQPGDRAYFNSELLNSHNTINSQQNSNKKSAKPQKIKASWERLIEKNDTKNAVCKLLNELEEFTLAKKMRSCCARFHNETCGDHITRKKVSFHCNQQKVCPFCGAIRAQSLIKEYLPKVEAYYKKNASLTPCHLIITQKDYACEILLDSIIRLLTNFRKLVRNKFWKKHLPDGGLYGIEFTRNFENGAWHTHMHLLVFRREYFKVAAFRKEWLAVTGDSVNFKIVRVKTMAGGLREVVKYVAKPLDVNNFKAEDLKQVLDLKGVHMFSTFGKFRAFCQAFEDTEPSEAELTAKPVDSGLCSHCGEPLFILSLPILGQIQFEKFIADKRKSERLIERQQLKREKFLNGLSARICLIE